MRRRLGWPVICAGMLLGAGAPGSAEPGAGLTGYATYYTVASCRREGTSGIWTASGERFDEAALACALPSRAFGGRYRVCNLDTKPPQCAVVRHNDFGPAKWVRRQRGVVIDLTPAALRAIGGDPGRGRLFVTVVPVGAPR